MSGRFTPVSGRYFLLSVVCKILSPFWVLRLGTIRRVRAVFSLAFESNFSFSLALLYYALI